MEEIKMSTEEKDLNKEEIEVTEELLDEVIEIGDAEGIEFPDFDGFEVKEEEAAAADDDEDDYLSDDEMEELFPLGQDSDGEVFDGEPEFTEYKYGELVEDEDVFGGIKLDNN
jgi:hypothetical protein